MRVSPLFLALAPVAAALSACAPNAAVSTPGAGPERQCFYADHVNNFRPGEPGAVYVRTMPNQVFKLNASGACLNLSHAQGIAFAPEMRGVSRLCVGDWTTVVPSGGTPPRETCRMHVEKALTAAELEALPARYRP